MRTLDLLIIVIISIISLYGCTKALDSTKPTNARYYLFTRRNINLPQAVTLQADSFIRSYFYALDPILIVIPRWGASIAALETNVLRNSRMEMRSYNVIAVDERRAGVEENATVLAIGAEIAQLIVMLHEQLDVKLEQFQLAGFGAGAHIAGVVGRAVEQRLGGMKLPQITALDPAGAALYNNNNKALHLTSNAADFVEVVHTNAGGTYGSAMPCGHIDYYVNGGRDQAGCGERNDLCSHQRAYNLVPEMWGAENEYLAAKCASEALINGQDCRWTTHKMGERTEKRGIYYIETNPIFPFSKDILRIGFL